VAGNVCTQKFEGVNVSECLRSASVSLGVPIENIKYLILEEKKGLFKKHAVISIDVIEGLKDEGTDKEDCLEKEETDKRNGTIEIKNGKFIIIDPKEGGKAAILSTSSNITLIVDGEKVSPSATVYAKSNIEVAIGEDEAKRYMNLRTSSDRMNAYIAITYKPKTTYKLKDLSPRNSLLIEIDVKEKIMPPKFTELEIKNELLNHNIKYGILNMNIMECAKTYEAPEMLVANGKKNIDAINDRMEIKYNAQNDNIYDNQQVIDYKAIGTVHGVEKGEVLAILYPGKNGVDGIDVTGKNIVTKTGSLIELDKLAEEPVDILVNGKKVAYGEVVVVDENFGVRITSIISGEERVKAIAK